MVIEVLSLVLCVCYICIVSVFFLIFLGFKMIIYLLMWYYVILFRYIGKISEFLCKKYRLVDLFFI